MADVQLVQGDTRPAIEGLLTKTRTGDPLDLTNASEVRFQMRKDDDERYTVDGVASIIGEPEEGAVRYEWQENDLRNPGDYIAQWQITWSDDTVQTTTPANTIEIRRQ